ncbi:hypothetical protein Hhel01_04270 [Haloferula helveola]
MTAVYHWEQMGSTLPKFERRTTVCSAPNEAQATERLLAEAKEYPATEQIKFLGDYLVQELDDSPGDLPVEVAHEMTIGVHPESGAIIDPKAFVDQHWGRSKIASCDALGFEHVWYNLDGMSSGCYNCEAVREGRLWERAAETKRAEQGGGGSTPISGRVGSDSSDAADPD